MVRYTSVQVFTDHNTKTVAGYKEGPQGGAGSKPHQVDKVNNAVSGSCAGAGSEQFHIYLNSRRREVDRITGMEKDFVKHEADKIFAEKIDRNKREADDKTKKNAEKRKRKKMKKNTSKKISGNGVRVSEDDDDEDSEAEGAEDSDEVLPHIAVSKVFLDEAVSKAAVKVSVAIKIIDDSS